jgi:large subunit ribosomal protein L16
LKRLLKGHGKGWLKIFPNMPITKKPEEVRMGKGKANVKFWAAILSKGDPIIEMKGCSWAHAKKVFLQVRRKLSVKTYLKLNKNF